MAEMVIGGTLMNLPTEKQEDAVAYICRRLNIPRPAEYSRQSYWKFINENLPKAQWQDDDFDDCNDDEGEHLFMDAGGYY